MLVNCFPPSDAQTALHATSVLASYAVLVSSFLSLYKGIPNPPTFFNSNKPQLCFLHLLHLLILSAKSLDANMNPPLLKAILSNVTGLLVHMYQPCAYKKVLPT